METNTTTQIIILRGHGLADRVIAARLGISLAAVKAAK